MRGRTAAEPLPRSRTPGRRVALWWPTRRYPASARCGGGSGRSFSHGWRGLGGGRGFCAGGGGRGGPASRERIHGAPGPRWFAPDRPIRTVHGDASMFVGGLRALLLQSLHPLAMAAVAAHSGYRGDPWGRLQRTSTFLAVTTCGAAHDAQQAVDRVRAIHGRVSGTASDGRSYHADDPHLLR